MSAPTAPPITPVAADDATATPPRKRKIKWRYVIALVACVGAIVWMITSLSANIDYLETVSQAVHDRPSQENRELRIGGVVVLHTLKETPQGASFRLGDGKAIVFVDVTNIPSKLFAECAPVVVEGKWSGTNFAADNLLVKHGATYGASNKDDAKSVKDALAGTGCEKPT
ncbi:MAG TPA: cytochrome c maturation protein CcmE [Acidimicrobiia bacterium]